jgi:folate-dependent phosphoribosylglycinamide formyltransferase PurN
VDELHRPGVPRVVLMCGEGDRIDILGLTAWIATQMDLVGVIKLREPRSRMWQRIHREIKRVGFWRLLDVLAFRVYYRLAWARRDSAWIEAEVARLQLRYRADPSGVMTLVTEDLNSPAVKAFLRWMRPDIMLARCETLLKPEIFSMPARGTYVLHPGICPEYRNAHGCFWALVNRDKQRVGMTLLKMDIGVDAGPILLQCSYAYDEIKESPTVMQYRVVTENLDSIGEKLKAAWRGKAEPLPARKPKPGTWGQPWLSAYLRWKQAARQEAAQ